MKYKKEIATDIKPFVKTPRKSGDSYVITIPASYFGAGTVNPEKKYEIWMSETDEEEVTPDE